MEEEVVAYFKVLSRRSLGERARKIKRHPVKSLAKR